jgi:hypothetical protein
LENDFALFNLIDHIIHRCIKVDNIKYLLFSFTDDFNTKFKKEEPYYYFSNLALRLKNLKTKTSPGVTIQRLFLVNESSINSKELKIFANHYAGNNLEIRALMRSAAILNPNHFLVNNWPVKKKRKQILYVIFQQQLDKFSTEIIPEDSRIVVKETEPLWTRILPPKPVVIKSNVTPSKSLDSGNISELKNNNISRIYYKKGSNTVFFIFNGQHIVLPRNNYDGMYYIYLLLVNKKQSKTSYVDLYLENKRFTQSKKEGKKQIVYSTPDFETTSKEELTKVENKLKDLQDRYENKFSILTDAQRDKYDKEIAGYVEFIKKHTGRAGKPRKISGAATKIKRTVKKSINDALDTLLDYKYTEFHQYLKKSINLEGPEPEFFEIITIEWQLIYI